MRINARLDTVRAGKLRYLSRKIGANLSQVIKRAIDAYYAQVRQEKPDPVRMLEGSGFIGCAHGPHKLSATYKEALKTALDAKHGHR
jgi:hypothetical protein